MAELSHLHPLMQILVLIGSLFIFIWFGNFLTTFYYRIPRNIPVNGITNPPMCSNCGTKIKWPYFGPLIAFILTDGTCKICKSKIPKEYLYIEIGTTLILFVNFLTKGFTGNIVAQTLFIWSLIMAALINYKHRTVHEKTTWIVLTLGLINIGTIQLDTQIILTFCFAMIFTMAIHAIKNHFKDEPLTQGQFWFLIILAFLITTKIWLIVLLLSFLIDKVGLLRKKYNIDFLTTMLILTIIQFIFG